MDLSTFLRALRRSWLPALLVLEVCLLGAIVYARQTIQSKAEATIAVRDPLTVRPGDYQAAQITFDAIVNSRRLSERVAARLGQSVEHVEAALAVEVVPPEAGMNISPLYAVKGEEANDAAALALVNAAVEEARILYVELNQTSAEEVRSTLAEERAEAAEALSAARAAFDEFVTGNGAENLPVRLENENARVNNLRQRVDEATADLAGARAFGQPAGVRTVRERLAEFERQLGETAVERDRLQGLEARYAELLQVRNRAEAQATQLDDLEQRMIVSQLLPLESQIKWLDDARIASQLLMTLLVYAVAVILGVLAAATVVYLQALRDDRRETPETIRLAFGAPVLAHLPAGALRGVAR